MKFPEVNKTEVLLLFDSSIQFFLTGFEACNLKCVFRKRHKWKIGGVPSLLNKDVE